MSIAHYSTVFPKHLRLTVLLATLINNYISFSEYLFFNTKKLCSNKKEPSLYLSHLKRLSIQSESSLHNTTSWLKAIAFTLIDTGLQHNSKTFSKGLSKEPNLLKDLLPSLVEALLRVPGIVHTLFSFPNHALHICDLVFPTLSCTALPIKCKTSHHPNKFGNLIVFFSA